jgi:transposase
MKKTNTGSSESQSEEVLAKAKIMVLGLDVHAEKVTVVRQRDGSTPQPAQNLRPEQLEGWIKARLREAQTVWSCYEAGPFGFQLHRQLESWGVRNLVVAPQLWDEQSSGVKTDQRDARALCLRLAMYAGGNRHALTVVHVPTQAQEQLRVQSRERDQIRRNRQRVEAQGRSLLLGQGYRLGYRRWWLPSNWQKLQAQLPPWLVKLLALFQEQAALFHRQVLALTEEIEAAAPLDLPVGLGALTSEVLAREVIDWNRFANRRQVASYTGLCPGEHSSGSRRRQGPITKHGNPRLRQNLIELAWRLVRYQPHCHAVARWQPRLRQGAPSARKKAIVAVARQLAVDLWRINTGRAGAEELGLRIHSL